MHILICFFYFAFSFHFLLQGRLNELMSQLRMQTQVPGARADQQCALDPMLTAEIRQVHPSNLHIPGSRGVASILGWWSFIYCDLEKHTIQILWEMKGGKRGWYGRHHFFASSCVLVGGPCYDLHLLNAIIFHLVAWCCPATPL